MDLRTKYIAVLAGYGVSDVEGLLAKLAKHHDHPSMWPDSGRCLKCGGKLLDPAADPVLVELEERRLSFRDGQFHYGEHSEEYEEGPTSGGFIHCHRVVDEVPLRDEHGLVLRRRDGSPLIRKILCGASYAVPPDRLKVGITLGD